MAQWLEHWTLNQEDLSSNSFPAASKQKVVLPSHCLSSFTCINEYLAINSGVIYVCNIRSYI